MLYSRPGRFKMSLLAQWLHSVLFIATALSLALPIANPSTFPQSQSLSLVNGSNEAVTIPPASNVPYNASIESTVSYDDSVRSLNGTKNPYLKCSGPEFGYDLDKESCIDAWRSIPTDQEYFYYGARGQGLFEVPLPIRYLSCKSPSLPRRLP